MKSELRFVLDANLIVSAVLFENSIPRRALDKARFNYTVVVSSFTITEITDVLTRKKFDRYVSLYDRQNFLSDFLKSSELISITEKIVACRDSKDDKYLELAVSANASAIVSSDDDLLVLNPFRNIPILTPNAFLEHDFSQRFT
jgi:uncharacterized protein